MNISSRCFIFLVTCTALLLGFVSRADDKLPRIGPQTEKRFPPLRVPPHFKATLFACDPLVEYLSAVALGPRPGSVFVAVDYLTGLGTQTAHKDEIRLVEDTDGDGYADKATVFARGFNSIQGLTYHDGKLYVMHAPFLTVLEDTRGKGVADRRRDLLSGLGLTPEENPARLHCANGLVIGHDGWLYLALGDHGCKVRRPEGDQLVLNGGGILRCRPDGRDLHVFSTGLRNIYDVALDAELNVFVRDNENDGGDYMIRVCHSFFGADHGYPYLYSERPDEALPPLADMGRGSSAGGLCYLERQFPKSYRGQLFFCEWGRAVVTYAPRPAGSAFAPVKEVDFAAGAANDPYGFKPTDLVVERDGSLIVVDWADDQRPMRGRGRIYRIRYVGKEGGRPARPLARAASLKQCLARLDSDSSYERCRAQRLIAARGPEGSKVITKAITKHRLGRFGRLHAIWLLARGGGTAARDRLFAIAENDPDPGVRAQAVRALADLSDPVFARHRLDARQGDAAAASRLARLARRADPRVQLEVVIALARLRWAGTVAWLCQALDKPDAALAHAAMQAMRRVQDWPGVLSLLDRPTTDPLRVIAVRACADQAVPKVVDGLIARLRTESDARRRRAYADLLTRVARKPGPWVYWGYRSPPRSANTVAWERTTAIEDALDRVLADPDRSVRLAVMQRMEREKIPIRRPTLDRWLAEDRQPERVAALLAVLRDRPGADVRKLIAAVAKDPRHTPANRLAALDLLVQGLDVAAEKQLLELAEAVEDGPVLAAVLRHLGRRPRLEATTFLLARLQSPRAEVRAASLDALAARRTTAAAGKVVQLLGDPDGQVRRAAAAAAGQLRISSARVVLLKLTQDPEPAVRRASLDALRLLHEPRAVSVAVAALSDRATEATALECIGSLGGPEQADALIELAGRTPSAEVLAPVVRILTNWEGRPRLMPTHRRQLGRAIAELQGGSGMLLRWQVWGPVPAAQVDALLKEARSTSTGWQTRLAANGEAPIVLDSQGLKAGASWLASTDVRLPTPTTVQFLAAAGGTLRVWLNGRPVHHRNQPQVFRLDADRFPARLDRGTTRILVQVAAKAGPVQFHLRFRRTSSRAEHEQLTQAALTQPGDSERGRALFFNVEKTQCLKCHHLAGRGERIGPDLTGVGGRFSRIHLIESILEPSRAIAPSYQTWLIVFKDGRQLSGVKMAETEHALTLGDTEGKKHELKKSAIEEQRPLPQSTMPEGLEKRLTPEEFVDLIAFLASRKERKSP
jgi:putative membrane-bound dehydrogenase-like protein